MDNHTLAITVSAGAIGATLAYLGYNNYINKDDDVSCSRADIPSPVNKIVSTQSPVSASEQEKVKLEVKEEVHSKKKAIKSEWGQFWQGEYNAQRDDADAAQEVQAGDFN